jgi:hypothetical protein
MLPDEVVGVLGPLGQHDVVNARLLVALDPIIQNFFGPYSRFVKNKLACL